MPIVGRLACPPSRSGYCSLIPIRPWLVVKKFSSMTNQTWGTPGRNQRAKDKERRTKSEGQGTKSEGQRAKDKERRTKSEGQRAKDKERRIRSPFLSFALCPLSFALCLNRKAAATFLLCPTRSRGRRWARRSRCGAPNIPAPVCLLPGARRGPNRGRRNVRSMVSRWWRR